MHFMSLSQTNLFVLIQRDVFVCGIALFHGDKATERSGSTHHHGKQSAAPEKSHFHSNDCTLDIRVYAHILQFCFNLRNSQIEGITDCCNYEKIVKQDYCLMFHTELSYQ